MESHDIVLLGAVVCIAAIGITYIFNGGDGAALVGSTTAIGGLLGYKMAEKKKGN